MSSSNPGDKVSLPCQNCPKRFSYILKRSPFRPKFCDSCKESRKKEQKRDYDKKPRKTRITDKQKPKRIASLLRMPDYEMNPEAIINWAQRIAT